MKRFTCFYAFLCGTLIYSQEITVKTRNNPSAYEYPATATSAAIPFRSGFFQANVPENFPGLGHETSQWRHLIDVRHDDPRFAMQISGYYWDQYLWFRKIGDGFLNQEWSRIVAEDASGAVHFKNRSNTPDGGNRLQFGSLGGESYGPYIRSSLSNASGVNTMMALKMGSYWKGEKNELTLINGRVGINSSSPVRTLSVNGDIYAEGGSSLSFQDDARFEVLKSDVPSLSNNSVSMPHYGLLAPNAGGSAELWFAGNSGIRMFTGGDPKPKFYMSSTGNAAFQAKIEAREIKVTQSPTADFVFADNYNLPKLEEVEEHIKEKRHLPEIASAKEMEKEGVNIGEFQIKLLQKIEELTLYSIEQNKELQKLKAEIKELKKK
ncbi:hypothetical protein [Epilithonimonas vandammei]|uniref:hypothetical protein n=1 Tax=Epilithonimonas vandammei TaxID=2487072 RepID=UPI001E4ADDD4|nr:hypothetical protein [Epilithonimonas vandammei]